MAREIYLGYARYGGNPGLQCFVQIAAGLRGAGAQINIGGHDLVQPFVHRVAEGGDHDRHRGRQRHAGQHAGGGHHGMPRRGTQARGGKSRRYRAAPGQHAGNHARHGWQQHHAAGQQAGHRQIAAEWQPIERRNPARREARQQQRPAQRGMPAPAEQGGFVTGF